MANLSRQSNGHLSRVSGGELGKCPDVECEECGYCSDGDDECDPKPGCPTGDCCTPHRWSVTASGFSPCLACVTSTGPIYWRVTSFSISGAYILTQKAYPSTCTWENTNIGSITYTLYSGASCTGSTTVNNSGNIGAHLEKTGANAYRFQIGNADALAGNPGVNVFDQGGIGMTALTGTDADQCDHAITASSNYFSSCLGISGGFQVTTGGSHIITPCP